MQFKFSAFILAALCGSAVNSAALPETDGAAPSHFDTGAIPLESRALVKLNQYRTLDDWCVAARKRCRKYEEKRKMRGESA